MAAIYFGAQYLERHITILDHGKTKDGLVSINPEDILEVKMFSELNKTEQLAYLKINIELILKQCKVKLIEN